MRALLLLASAPILVLLLCSASAQAMSVAFVAPGYANEPYWAGVVSLMQQAAQDLGIDFQPHYANRDRLLEIQQVAELAALPLNQRPQYLIVAGEKRTLPEQLKLARTAGLKVFLIANTPTAEERLQVGKPRQIFDNWLGSLTPKAEQAGYLTAKALIEEGISAKLQDSSGHLHLLALSGSRSTESSLRRNQGLQQALAEYPQVILHQTVHADWQTEKALLQTRHLLRRYPQTRLIWAGNDLMAFGALQAAREEGRIPGQDLLFSAINATPAAMQALVNAQLSALAGGHYMTGAWALVLLYDYDQGIDFAKTEELEMEYPMFHLFSVPQAQAFLDGHRGPTDFRHYSKAHNPRLTHYDFSYRLEQCTP